MKGLHASTGGWRAPSSILHPVRWLLVRPDGSRCTLLLERATNPLSRARGLLGRELPGPGSGLWIEPCRAVHSFGMSASIDLLFVDPEGCVIRVRSQFARWRIAACRAARSTIELQAGEASRLRIEPGARLMSYPNRHLEDRSQQ